MDDAFSRLPERQPLYQQVQNILVERILNGGYPEGSFLPNEYELSQEFRVSIGTIRKAVEALIDHKMVLRQQGRGTVVTFSQEAACEKHLGRFRSHDGEPLKDWIKQPISDGVVPAFGDLALRMKCEEGVDLQRTVRLVTCGAHWRVYEETYAPLAHNAGQANVHLAPSNGFDASGAAVRVEESLGVEAPLPDIAEALGVSADRPVLCVSRVSLDRISKPVEYRRMWAHTATGGVWVVTE